MAPVSFADEPNNWTSFQAGGRCQLEMKLPITWSSEPESLAWSAELPGYGQSTPVVFDSSVFVTSTSGPNKELFHLTCFELQSGKLSWQIELKNPTPEESSSYVSRAAPTPVVDSQAVYVLNEGGALAGIDHSGKTLWTRDLVSEFGAITARHGLASSLEQNHENLFVWIERSDDPYLMCVEKSTGATVWKIPGLGATTWGSPRLVSVADEQHLVCSASGSVVGFHPATGERLWELTGLANNTSSTPIPVGAEGRFFLGASDGRGEENAGKGASSNGLVQITTTADGTYQASFIWRADKASCSFGSPIVAGGKVWIVNRSGALYQLELETGKQLSVSRVQSGSIWATPLSDSEHVLLFGQKGTTSVLSIESGEEVAVNQLRDTSVETVGEPSTVSHVQYAAAAAQGHLLIRRGDRIYAIR